MSAAAPTHTSAPGVPATVFSGANPELPTRPIRSVLAISIHLPQTVTPSSRLDQIGRFLLRGLRIGASTVSLVELLRSDWTGGLSAALAWVVFLQVERRLPPSQQTPSDGGSDSSGHPAGHRQG